MPSAGSTKGRGYGHRHRELRAQWKIKVERGEVDCWRCQKPIAPDADWDLGHDDNDRTRYMGPEHTGCNRATASRRPSYDTSRPW